MIRLRDAARSACDDVGIEYRDVRMDGQFHATNLVDDSRGRGDGRIKLFPDGTGGIAYNWKSGGCKAFFVDDEQMRTPSEHAELVRSRNEAIQQAEADKQRSREEAKKKGEQLWGAATPTNSTHPYLARKQVRPVDTLREIDSSMAVNILGYVPKSSGEPLRGRILLAPVRLGDSLSTVEMIDQDGRKSAIAGGQKGGAYWVAQPIPLENTSTIVIGEGVATVLSVQAATGYPVVAALSSGNLRSVAHKIRHRYPDAKIIVLADLLRDSGEPDAKAVEAAQTVEGCLAIPDFGTHRLPNQTDFNDLHVAQGLDAVRHGIGAAKSVALRGDASNNVMRLAVDTSTNAAFSARAGELVPKERAHSLTDFYAYLPSHQYIYTPTGELWPASSVNQSITFWPKNPRDSKPMRPSEWLDSQRSVEQMIWAPGEPLIVEDRVVNNGGWLEHAGSRVFNQYREPPLLTGNPSQADRWIQHLRRVYPDDWQHILQWLAHRVQRPGEKINHALVLGGNQGIGKDTILEPVKHAIGSWNWQEISPAQMLARFNGWVKAVVLRINEARDLGELNRFAFYDHAKTYMAAPPDVIRVDEKHIREHAVFNVMGVIITTNHRTDGIYLPADDRRHYVAWSDLSREDFPAEHWRELYEWYDSGGREHVAAYLRTLDLSEFDPKAPPLKTPAFWAIVQAGQAPEDSELSDVIEQTGSPDAITLGMLESHARTMGLKDFANELVDRRTRRSLPHKLERAGYVVVRNPDAKDGYWMIGRRRGAVYARASLPVSERMFAARELYAGRNSR